MSYQIRITYQVYRQNPQTLQGRFAKRPYDRYLSGVLLNGFRISRRDVSRRDVKSQRESGICALFQKHFRAAKVNTVVGFYCDTRTQFPTRVSDLSEQYCAPSNSVRVRVRVLEATTAGQRLRSVTPNLRCLVLGRFFAMLVLVHQQK